VRNWPSRFWNHQASISGMAIFMISLGWMTMPTLTQRCAPFFVMPNSATAMSRARPTVYSGTASAMSFWGGSWENTNITPMAMSMLRPCSSIRPGTS
jgi:hypothetical protein